MHKIFVKFSVKDYGIWKKAFDAGTPARSAAGVSTVEIIQSADDPNLVMVVLETADLGRARAHLTDPEVRAKQQNAGFRAPPEMFFGKVAPT